MTRARNRHMKVLLDAAATSRDGTVLDAGCGDGETSRYLAERGCNVVAVDPVVPEYVSGTAHSIGTGVVRWIAGDFLALDAAHRYGAVCLLNVLHRASDWAHARAFLDQATQMLQQRGVLALSWISDDIAPDEPAYLPPKDVVREYLIARGLRIGEWREVVVEHAHASWLAGALHKHLIVYSVWYGIEYGVDGCEREEEPGGAAPTRG